MDDGVGSEFAADVITAHFGKPEPDTLPMGGLARRRERLL
jgi:hypothetical protein